MLPFKRLWLARKFADSPWRHLFEPYRGDELIAIDTETTGLDPRQADVLSIAAVPIRGNRVLTSQRLELTLAASPKLTGDSIRIHGLRHQDLQQGLSPDKALPQLLGFIQNRPLLGYHVLFDIAILSRLTREHLGFELPNRHVELAHLYRRRQLMQHPELEPDLGFEHMAQELGVPLLARHSAFGDALTTALMFLTLRQRGAA
ncbi:DNA polymerase III subunit epsilon [Zobellella endophytica]|uniref:DNA polymerase III subunit epsilon n=1 Tax=Zobellella endophytica TaxID=2116700 RepID=A0A2P7R3J3_9GAMM|nr:3'-5' exonuclease [Zobellella endophytica]PSJ44766.1 DNA polymerase III subunit epsilon [Zobellella endophytica]